MFRFKKKKTILVYVNLFDRSNTSKWDSRRKMKIMKNTQQLKKLWQLRKTTKRGNIPVFGDLKFEKEKKNTKKNVDLIKIH